MRVVVNLTRCQAYAQCAFLAPEVFRMRGVEALMYDPEPDDAQKPANASRDNVFPGPSLRSQWNI